MSRREVPRGAFGPTRVTFTPAMRRALEVDIYSCLHCGLHHASAPAVMAEDGTITAECPSLRRPIHLTCRLFIHPV